jgi:hypothetical protein
MRRSKGDGRALCSQAGTSASASLPLVATVVGSTPDEFGSVARSASTKVDSVTEEDATGIVGDSVRTAPAGTAPTKETIDPKTNNTEVHPNRRTSPPQSSLTQRILIVYGLQPQLDQVLLNQL